MVTRLPGTPTNVITDFNDAGEIVVGEGEHIEVRSTSGVSVLPKPVVAGSEKSVLQGFFDGDSGRVVGLHRWDYTTETNAVSYQGASPPQVITVLSTVKAVSDSGVMFGTVHGEPRTYAVVKDGALTPATGLATNSTTFIGSVHGFNDAGQLLYDTAEIGQDQVYHLWSNGVDTVLPGSQTPGITDSEVVDVNNSGVVLMEILREGSQWAPALRFPDGQLSDVVDLAGGLPNGWILDYSIGFNDQCQVVALAHHPVDGDFEWRNIVVDVPGCEQPPFDGAFFRTDLKPPSLAVDEQIDVRLRVENISGEELTNVAVQSVEAVPTDSGGAAEIVQSGDDLPEVLGATGLASQGFVDFSLVGKEAGMVVLSARVAAIRNGEPVSGTIESEFTVRSSALRVDLSAGVPGADPPSSPGVPLEFPLDDNDHDNRFEVDVTITNTSDEPVTDVAFLDPAEPVGLSSLRVDDAGIPIPGVSLELLTDPLPPIDDTTLDPGEATSLTYLYEAFDSVDAELDSLVTGVQGEEAVRGSGTVGVKVLGEDPFVWEMTPRFEANDDGRLPYSYDRGDLNPDTFEVVATMRDEFCESDLEFTLDGGPLVAVDRDGCKVTFDLAEGSYAIQVSADGTPVGAVDVEVDDLLIVVLGDSVASGEGNPGPFGYRGPVDGCHRSQEAAGAKAAATIEEENDQTSVTFLHLACSGASVLDGLLSYQLLFFSGPAQVDQLALLDSLVDREIDIAVMQAGANDLGFSSIVNFCVSYETCEDLPFGLVTSKAATEQLWLPGAYNVPRFNSFLCDAAAAGDTSLNVFGLPLPSPSPIPTTDPLDDALEFMFFDPRGWTATLNPGQWDYSDDRTDDSTGPSPQFDVIGVSGGGGLFDCEGQGLPLSVALDDDVDQDWPRSLNNAPQKREGLVAPQVQPQVPVVAFQAPTLDEWVEIHLEDPGDGLASRYTRLGEELSSFDVEETFLVEYPDELTGSDGESCSPLYIQGGLGLDHWEIDWARDEFVQPLNRAVHAAAADNGWTAVGGIEEGFHTHGYCATDGWVNTITDAVDQANVYGILHPNAKGHDFMAGVLVDAIRGEVDNAAAGDIVTGFRPTSVLEERADPGDTRLTLDPTGFDVGDQVIVDPGSGVDEQRQVTGIGSIIVDKPLEHAHPVGALVVKIADGTLDDPTDDGDDESEDGNPGDDDQTDDDQTAGDTGDAGSTGDNPGVGDQPAGARGETAGDSPSATNTAVTDTSGGSATDGPDPAEESATAEPSGTLAYTGAHLLGLLLIALALLFAGTVSHQILANEKRRGAKSRHPSPGGGSP